MGWKAGERSSLELPSRRGSPFAVLVVSFVVEVALAGAFAPDANCVDTVVRRTAVGGGRAGVRLPDWWLRAGSTSRPFLLRRPHALFLTLATASASSSSR